ncbi:MAG: 2Fe-2S iron-sulfur cluster-binding protein [Crocinitomicaceae bacterium]|jgi:ring-1,2-phenylacetyl-CoA epoxidase subunit PaaE|nr:2Fe-2S iron-sulfur cluster-binding protein [Crocinitomicaceae bacterium]MDP4865207.1 2Fe-2S iron-sulfur cluster-binding protein [Crocinitomicaceae bacterium]MDP5010488.1 2Fe-2S iron-sulfur cluster-binding protein [Crocinitomicaceae bacterium]MDP5098709.1 2Fe-2S iron-sulfur cluster-binding protein [Crocinitomicaceae bacterium]
MALFGLFKKDNKEEKKGFFSIEIASVEKLTADTVQVTLAVPTELSSTFKFIPGQYINVSVELNGKEERRSYSICSGEDEALSFAVKAIENGKVSVFFNTVAKEGTKLFVSKPEGNFKLDQAHKNVVAIAAGSGITPMLSIAKALRKSNGKMRLFYGNRMQNSIIFHKQLAELENVNASYFLTGEQADGFLQGRISKETFSEQIKADLDILKADAFFICGPEQMIMDVSETLKFFGVAESKIHFELFTTPVLMQSETVVTSNFDGDSKVKIILDSEVSEFKLNAKGKTVLEALEAEGLDAPFSCRGGVCCSCRAKILKGTATMKMNYTLTDEDIKKGYILTCQAHPSSEELIVSFDE